LYLHFKDIAPVASACYSDAKVDYKMVVIASLSIFLDASTLFCWNVYSHYSTTAVFLVVQW
jgi:hypothetical protein